MMQLLKSADRFLQCIYSSLGVAMNSLRYAETPFSPRCPLREAESGEYLGRLRKAHAGLVPLPGLAQRLAKAAKGDRPGLVWSAPASRDKRATQFPHSILAGTLI